MKAAALIGSALAATLTGVLVPAFAGGSGDAAQPPRTTIAAGPIGPTNAMSASFMFSADQQGSRFFCALDSTNYSLCTSPITYNGLVNGQHTFFVNAVNDGQRGATASWSWIVDTVPPGPVSRVHAKVGYGKVVISWTPSVDTDHVVILRGMGAETGATQVYAGAGTSYVERKFVNALEHRYSFVSYDKAGNVSPPAGLNVEPSALFLAPTDGAQLRRTHPPALRWRGVRRATFYNVQLWRGKQKLLTTWPHRPHLKLGRAWTYKTSRIRLKPGLYTWFVWPGFGAPAKGIYGRLLGTATFRVG